MNRRGFLGAMVAAAVLDPERLLWVPGQKVISIPRERPMVWVETYSVSRTLFDLFWPEPHEQRSGEVWLTGFGPGLTKRDQLYRVWRRDDRAPFPPFRSERVPLDSVPPNLHEFAFPFVSPFRYRPLPPIL